MRDPREQQAWHEVGHTVVSPALARGIVAWFLVAIAALPLAEQAAARRPSSLGGAPSPWSRLADLPGTVASTLAAPGNTGSVFWDRLVPANRAMLAAFSAFEAALEDQSAVGRALRPPAQAVLSRWLGAGNERVYVGRDGWLFFRSDVESVTGPGFLEPSSLARRRAAVSELTRAPAPDSRPAIIDFARDLAARGTQLVVVPIPVKPTIHPDRLTTGLTAADAPVHNRSYAGWLDDLRQAGVVVFDATPVLLTASAEGLPAYLESDTHWRPHAMEATAEALAGFLTGQVRLPAAAPAGYRVEPREARQPGDTAAMLEVSTALLPRRAETVALRMVLRPDGDPGGRRATPTCWCSATASATSIRCRPWAGERPPASSNT